MKWAVAIAMFAHPVWADDVARAQSCLDRNLNCFGQFADICLEEQGNPPVIPALCWVREEEAWQEVLNRAYSKVLLDTFTTVKPVTERVRAERETWIIYRAQRCAVETMSNPRTSGSVEAGCLARMTYDRALDVSARLGADWTEY